MQEYNLYSETDTRKIIIGKLQRMFSSCQINILVGSAFSLPQLKTLENIESDLTAAILEQDENKEYKIKTNFFEKSIKPIQTTNPNGNDFKEKREFIKTITDIIDLRESSVVHKGINIFTTNYDNFLELSIEKNSIDYFDGFNGRIGPEFSTANFGKHISRQSSLTGRLAEKVSINLYKLHGSIYWKEDSEKIVFDDYQERFERIKAASNRKDFLDAYSSLAIVNPEKSKFNSTVMNSNYYDQIRMFSNEMDRQNSLMLVFGFSFADEHMLQVVERALKSNPTFTMLLFPYNDKDLEYFRNHFKFNNNVYCYYKKNDGSKTIDNYELNNLNELLLEIYNGIK